VFICVHLWFLIFVAALPRWGFPDTSMDDLHFLTAWDLAARIRARQVRAVEAVEAVFRRIDAVEPKVHAYLTLTRESALASARAVDAAIDAGKPVGPLAGVPVALKDVLCTRGVRTTCASRILEHYVPPYDATVVRRLADAGAVIVGKTNLDEFAMGSSTENSAFGPTRNPWDLGRLPGGSSGGSAAAVAAGLAHLALGSDTGGSIRQPAALCGVVGLKPTYGRVSRYGLVAFASSLDQIGPFGRDVRDAALLLGVVAGRDPLDSTSLDAPVPDYLASIEDGVKGLRIGIPPEYFGEGVQPEVAEAVERSIRALESRGARRVTISLPRQAYGIATYYIVAPAEASSNLARYDGTHYGHRAAGVEGLIPMVMRTRREGFGPEVKRRIMLGTYTLSSGYYDAYYNRALKVRRLIKDDFDRAFADCDVIAGPTSPFPAFKLGEKVEDPLQMYLCDIFTVTANLAGVPGISVPCGFTTSGLPIGFQLQAKALDEPTLFRAARAVEADLGVVGRRPNLDSLVRD
jgi:aspartyl-tRNA(Asn)/glutamyl-tRNA(Gln) amidotransferase subunit A